MDTKTTMGKVYQNFVSIDLVTRRSMLSINNQHKTQAKAENAENITSFVSYLLLLLADKYSLALKLVLFIVMEPSRSKRRRLLQSYTPPLRPDVPATFESLIDDTLTTVLEFVGKKSYRSFGGLNKQCREIYLSSGMTKETFLYGYAPLSVIQDRYDGYMSFQAQNALCKGVALYNRIDVLALLTQRRDTTLLNRICELASTEGRIDILEEMWNSMNDRSVDVYAARGGKLNVLKWYETKGLSINIDFCAQKAAYGGQTHIIQWLREEKGYQLKRELYLQTIQGGQLHVMKWLREQGCPWCDYTFWDAAQEGNLDVLQWLHNEGCPWPRGDNYRLYERYQKPEVIDWCRVNGYGNRIVFRGVFRGH